MKKMILILAALILLPALSIDTNAQLTKTVVSLTGNVFNEITKQPETVRPDSPADHEDWYEPPRGSRYSPCDIC